MTDGEVGVVRRDRRAARQGRGLPRRRAGRPVHRDRRGLALERGRSPGATRAAAGPGGGPRAGVATRDRARPPCRRRLVARGGAPSCCTRPSGGGLVPAARRRPRGRSLLLLAMALAVRARDGCPRLAAACSPSAPFCVARGGRRQTGCGATGRLCPSSRARPGATSTRPGPQGRLARACGLSGFSSVSRGPCPEGSVSARPARGRSRASRAVAERAVVAGGFRFGRPRAVSTGAAARLRVVVVRRGQDADRGRRPGAARGAPGDLTLTLEEYFPDFALDDQRQPFTRSREPRNPGALLTVESPAGQRSASSCCARCRGCTGWRQLGRSFALLRGRARGLGRDRGAPGAARRGRPPRGPPRPCGRGPGREGRVSALAGALALLLAALLPDRFHRAGVGRRALAVFGALALLPAAGASGTWPFVLLAAAAAVLATPLPLVLAAAGAVLVALRPEASAPVAAAVAALATAVAADSVGVAVRERRPAGADPSGPVLASGLLLALSLALVDGGAVLSWSFGVGGGVRARTPAWRRDGPGRRPRGGAGGDPPGGRGTLRPAGPGRAPGGPRSPGGRGRGRDRRDRGGPGPARLAPGGAPPRRGPARGPPRRGHGGAGGLPPRSGRLHSLGRRG